jgi:hypothetical protein
MFEVFHGKILRQRRKLLTMGEFQLKLLLGTKMKKEKVGVFIESTSELCETFRFSLNFLAVFDFFNFPSTFPQSSTSSPPYNNPYQTSPPQKNHQIFPPRKAIENDEENFP